MADGPFVRWLCTLWHRQRSAGASTQQDKVCKACTWRCQLRVLFVMQ